MIATGIILESNRTGLTGLPEVWKESDWKQITDEGTGEVWAYITSFSGGQYQDYWSQSVRDQFHHVFDDPAEFQNWLETGIMQYTENTIEL